MTNNIANVDTPNYKRQDVEFTTYLKSALSRSGGDSTSLTNRVNNINYNAVPSLVLVVLALAIFCEITSVLNCCAVIPYALILNAANIDISIILQSRF